MEKVAVSLEKIDLDYDEEADVLYISFGKPRQAQDSVEVEDGIIYRIADNEIVGITITNFKARTVKNNLACKI
jgi:uncharacterized protein YuzE